MALIFDSFKTRDNAEKFAATITKNFRLKSSVYNTQRESEPMSEEEGFFAPNPYCNGVKDVFPFKLIPPIVLVERPEDERGEIDVQAEEPILDIVEQFGGEFAGM